MEHEHVCSYCGAWYWCYCSTPEREDGDCGGCPVPPSEREYLGGIYLGVSDGGSKR